MKRQEADVVDRRLGIAVGVSLVLAAVVGLVGVVLRPQTVVSPRPCLRVVLAGPPASGKGTVSAFLLGRLGPNARHISTGDILRAEIASHSETGLAVAPLVASGQLVPDSLLLPTVLSRVAVGSASASASASASEANWILDGFPRTRAQAEALCTALSGCGATPTHVVVLELPDDVAAARITGRRVDPVTGRVYHLSTDPPPEGANVVAREDDTEERVRERLRVYSETTPQWLEAIKAMCPMTAVVRIDANQPRGKVFNDVSVALGLESDHGSGKRDDRWLSWLDCGSLVKPFC